MKRVVAIIGDYYHRPEHIAEALNQALRSRIDSGELDLKYIAIEQLQDALTEQPNVIIMFAEDRVTPEINNEAKWMSAEMATLIVRYVEEGGSWLAWHSGLASYDPDGAYVTMLRGHFLYHPDEHQLVRYSLEGKTDSFEILDEHYFVACHTEQTEVFLRSESIDGSSVAGWRHTFGEGRVCCLTPAHRLEGLLHQEALKLLNETVSWCYGIG
jgi:type 1 glutamine amidotransferase